MEARLAVIVGLIGFATLLAQNNKTIDVSAVSASGSTSGNRYTNSFFKLTVDAPKATLQADPLVNVPGQRARLVEISAKSANWDDTYTFAVLADSLAKYPQSLSPTQYVRSVRHQLEKEGFATVREEFSITIDGVSFTGAILEEHTQSGQKYYRGLYSTFRGGYILSFDAEASSEANLRALLSRLVKFAK